MQKKSKFMLPSLLTVYEQLLKFHCLDHTFMPVQLWYSS
jgi:hypothetical protein